jgi:hypothetical protein
MKKKLLFCLLLLSTRISIAQPVCDFLGRDSLFVNLSADTVHIWDLSACGNCASVFVTSVNRSADTLYVVQEDTSHLMALCDCLFNLRTSVVGIPAGTYTVALYRDWHVKFPSLTQPVFIGSLQFQYSPLGTASFSYRGFQSGCINDAVSQKSLPPPRQPLLLPNFPNPFNPSTTIRFQTSAKEYVVVKIFDLLGREIQTLMSEVRLPGLHSVRFEPRPGLSSGLYCYRLQAGSFVQTRTMLLLR